MKYKHAVLSLGIIVASCILFLMSCKKINEATELGGGLIPPVDNITTFDTTLEVQVFNDSFTLATDSTLYFVSYEHFLGMISNDPIFGKTDAQMFLQLKPQYYKYTFANRPDSLYIDSVVLVLDYQETYGDTLAMQNVNVYEITQASDFRYDTTYKLRETSLGKGMLLGSKSFQPLILNDSIKAFQDTTVNQLRIKLDNAFGQRLLSYDTTDVAGPASAYTSDSAFNANFKGFALESTSGNAIMGFNLSGDNTKLAIYYRYNNKSVTDLDTTVAYFTFSSSLSAAAQFVKRDYSGTPVDMAAGSTTAADYAYIQTTPGTFATIKIPDLAGLNNRIVHRAELIMEEVYDPSDTLFPAPDLLYLDAYDASKPEYRTIPVDFQYDFVSSNSNLTSGFGAVPFNSSDGSGNPIKTWHFNLSRYVQNIVNGNIPVYDLRLYAPLYTVNQYYTSLTSSATELTIGVSSPIKGRVRLAGGTGANPTQKMRLRIVYSKI